MNPNNLEPVGSAFMREMERITRRLNDDVDFINRAVYSGASAPVECAASVLNPLEDRVNALSSDASAWLHVINPAKHLVAAQDAVSNTIRNSSSRQRRRRRRSGWMDYAFRIVNRHLLA